MENCENSSISIIDEKIELGKSLIEKLDRDFIDVEGAVKTKRNILKEIKFLQKVSKIEKFFSRQGWMLICWRNAFLF